MIVILSLFLAVINIFKMFSLVILAIISLSLLLVGNGNGEEFLKNVFGKGIIEIFSKNARTQARLRIILFSAGTVLGVYILYVSWPDLVNNFKEMTVRSGDGSAVAAYCDDNKNFERSKSGGINKIIEFSESCKESFSNNAVIARNIIAQDESKRYDMARACLEMQACNVSACFESYIGARTRADNVDILIDVANKKLSTHACIFGSDEKRKIDYICGVKTKYLAPVIYYNKSDILTGGKHIEIHASSIETSEDSKLSEHYMDIYKNRLTSCDGFPQFVDRDGKKEDLPSIGGHEVIEAGSPKDFITTVNNEIFFEKNSAVLTDNSKKILDRQAKWIIKYSNINVIAEGHRDVAEDDKRISISRATIIANYLIAKGVKKSRIKIVDIGNERPLASCDEVQCKSQNQRAVTVLARRL